LHTFCKGVAHNTLLWREKLYLERKKEKESVKESTQNFVEMERNVKREK